MYVSFGISHIQMRILMKIRTIYYTSMCARIKDFGIFLVVKIQFSELKRNWHNMPVLQSHLLHNNTVYIVRPRESSLCIL